MRVRKLAAVIVASAVMSVFAGRVAHAENRMGYRLLSQSEAAALPRSGAALGLVVERAQQITDDGLTFDIMRATQVRPGSPAAQAQRVALVLDAPGTQSNYSTGGASGTASAPGMSMSKKSGDRGRGGGPAWLL